MDTFSKLYKEFMVYADNGDERGAHDFLVANIKNFPSDIQEKLVFLFFEGALLKDTEKVSNLAEQIEKVKDILKGK